MNTFSLYARSSAVALCSALHLAAAAAVANGQFALHTTDFTPGRQFDLTGQWSYKPGYLLEESQKPQLTGPAISASLQPAQTSRTQVVFAEAISANPTGYIPIPVPQILSRIQWWLDDSEDFKKHETERLAKLGFDTEKAEDGWYRLNVNMDQLPPGRRLFVQFDGIAMRSEVFWNGVSLGRHDGMFSRFEAEVTNYVRPGSNTLAVFVSMEKIRANDLDMGQAVTVNLTASKVKSMDKAVFGPMSPGRPNREYDLHGIWQPVRLVCSGAERMEDVWFKPSLTGAELQVLGPERMMDDPKKRYKVSAQWIDQETSTVFAEINNREYASTPVTLQLENVQPKLWTPADPHLYKLIVTLLAPSGETLDSWSHNVGFRTFEVRGNQLYLNGHPYWLRGADHLPYGKNPTDPALARKLIQQMHDNNERVTRTHCTPWNEAWLDVADEIGLGVSIEGPRPWAFAGKIGATPPELMRHWLMENEDIVRRCRNHPSVLIWTIGNEMMLRETDNPGKWAQLTAVVKQTRRLDPTRPIVCSSSYEREAKLYDKLLKPNGFDDGDIDDVHSYKGWYTESSFASDPLSKKSTERSEGERPFIGQEMSTGYPDLDTGLPALRYTADLMTPQAWIGQYAYPGKDPKWFLEHHAIVTKRWAEQLRYTRGNRTSGFFLFANECWFNHSYDPAQGKPYNVVEAVKLAWAPVGVALETNRRRFFFGENIKTNVFITNDDEQFRDSPGGELKLGIVPASGGVVPTVAKVPAIRYYETTCIPVEFVIPDKAPAQGIRGRQEWTLFTRYKTSESKEFIELDVPSDPVELFSRVPTDLLTTPPNVVILHGGSSLAGLAPGGELRQKVQAGATALVYSPGEEILKYFPDDVLSSTKVIGEFADWSPAADTPLGRDLQPMDIKWWARENDPRCFVASQAHRLKPEGHAREMIRFIPSHGYIKPEKVPEQIMTVLFEIPVGKGRVWVCDLDLDQCANVDPAAQLFQRNLFAAAADPHSMDKLKVLPSHEEMLKAVSPTHKTTVGLYEH